MPTIKEVAKRAGVSIGTVSNVITGTAPVSAPKRERILAAIRDLNYHPNDVARSLKLRRTKMLGMVVSDITNPFFSQLVRGAEEAALKHGYLLLTFNTDDQVEREKQVLAVLRSRRVDGILLVVAPSEGKPAHIAETLALGTPLVCLDRVPPGIEVDSVSVNNTAGARNCIRHLLAMGHRRIAILTGSLRLQTARQRLRGYEEALREAGIPVDPKLIYEGDFRAESGYSLGQALLAKTNRPSALFISNALMAIGVLKAVGELGLQCPRDIAIATFDDLPLAEILRTPLTAVAQPAHQIGYKGAELLVRKIEAADKQSEPVALRLPTELKIRESTVGAQPRSHRR
jgi:LacI family transcriptional regulator